MDFDEKGDLLLQTALEASRLKREFKTYIQPILILCSVNAGLTVIQILVSLLR